MKSETSMPLNAQPAAVRASGPAGDDLAHLRPSVVVLNPVGSLGHALREAREGLGLAVEDIAQATRVRAAHLSAIEAFELDRLPAWPFALGYVRAYARALGLDTEMVMARFRAEAPRPDETLRAPGGLFNDRRRFGLLSGAALLIGVAVLGWNVTRHAKANPPRTTASAPRIALPIRSDAGPVHLGAPLPPPPEASNPPTYQTPGLEPPNATPSVEGGVIGAPFVVAGTVYGAPGPASATVLQARKPTSLIVRGPQGAVYFARQLAAGEAWRAPAIEGLTIDVGNPASMEVFAAGVSRGVLTDTRTPLTKLGG